MFAILDGCTFSTLSYTVVIEMKPFATAIIHFFVNFRNKTVCKDIISIFTAHKSFQDPNESSKCLV